MNASARTFLATSRDGGVFDVTPQRPSQQKKVHLNDTGIALECMASSHVLKLLRDLKTSISTEHTSHKLKLNILNVLSMSI